MPVARLGPRDLDRALAVVAEAASIQGAQPFELPVIERLLDLIPGDRAGYFDYRRPGHDIYKVEYGPAAIPWKTEEITPLARKWYLPVDNRLDATEHAVRFSDDFTGRQRLRYPWYTEVMRKLAPPVEHELKVRLPAPEGIIRGFWVARGPDSRDFDERDCAVLTVLRPHLAAVRERWERRHRPTLLLTRREKEVLLLVRDGLTNGEIAARLVISAGTVRSHLEHVFEKLDVHTRTAALARAYGADTGLV